MMKGIYKSITLCRGNRFRGEFMEAQKQLSEDISFESNNHVRVHVLLWMWRKSMIAWNV